MNNLLCCILFCCSASSLVNADCPSYPKIMNATFNKKEECGDITIRCDEGFVMEQGTTCMDGEWKYQEPFCKPLDCNYTFTNDIYVSPNSIKYVSSLNQSECDKRCDDDTRCSTTYFNNGDCNLYPAPLISISLDTDLDQCKAKCTEMEECLMFSHWGGEQLCDIYNVTLINLPDDFTVDNHDDDTVAEKFCL